MMATNPKLPDYPDIPPRRSADQHGKVQMIRQSKFPWPLLGLIAGAALLIAIIAVLPKSPHVSRTPSAAQVPPQPTAEQIQLTNVQIAPAPVGDSLYLNAILHNAGDTAITGVQVNAQFMSANGAVVGNTNGAVQAVFGGTSSEDLTQAPIKPNESRPVRIYFEHTPKSWNHQVPQLTVTTVTGTTP
jgi:Protein of unknown function (DUF3426)